MSRAEIARMAQEYGTSQYRIRQEWRQWRRMELAAEHPDKYSVLRFPDGTLKVFEKSFVDLLESASN